jgi:hypothetical protein
MLLPKKPTEFYKKTAEENNVSEELVADLISFYWKEVRRVMSNCEAHNVIVEGLGTFKVKYWKIKEVLLKHENILNKYKIDVEAGEKISFYKFSILKDVQENMNKILELEKMIEADNLKKQSVKQKRYDQKVKNNLEEPGADMGRLQEPDIQD